MQVLLTLNTFLFATEIHFRVQTLETFLPTFSKLDLFILWLFTLFIFPGCFVPKTITPTHTGYLESCEGSLAGSTDVLSCSSKPRHSTVL